jgi:hypothetical protein
VFRIVCVELHMLQFPPLSHSSQHCSICSWCNFCLCRLCRVIARSRVTLLHWALSLWVQQVTHTHATQVYILQSYSTFVTRIITHYILICIQKYNKTYIVIMYSPNWEAALKRLAEDREGWRAAANQSQDWPRKKNWEVLWFRKYVESEYRCQYKPFESTTTMSGERDRM